MARDKNPFGIHYMFDDWCWELSWKSQLWYLHTAFPCDLGFLEASWLSSMSEHCKRTRKKLNQLFMTKPRKPVSFTSAWVTSLPKFKRREHIDTSVSGWRVRVALKSMRDGNYCYGHLKKWKSALPSTWVKSCKEATVPESIGKWPNATDISIDLVMQGSR